MEAKKSLFSMAVTEVIGNLAGDEVGGMKIDFADISRAYFQAAPVRNVYAEPSDEDHEEGVCGLLQK